MCKHMYNRLVEGSFPAGCCGAYELMINTLQKKCIYIYRSICLHIYKYFYFLVLIYTLKLR